MKDLDDKAKDTLGDAKNKAEQMADKAKAKYYKAKADELEKSKQSEPTDFWD
jgi:vacuolar-type H+-ATPase subunit E/Vma4